MGDELKFQLQWEFRRKENGFDSSSDDSKSSAIGEPVLKRHKLVSDLSSLDDDEINDTSGLQQNNNSNPGVRDQTELAKKAKEKKIRGFGTNNFADNGMKRDCHEEVNIKKNKTIVYDPAALDDVKNFSGFLLEDLRVTRENLFTWMMEEMNKLVADDNALRRGRSKRASRGKKVQLQHHNNSGKNVQFQQRNYNGVVVHVQQRNNFEDVEEHHQNNIQSGLKVQNCSGGSLERATQSIKSADTNDHSQTVDDRVDYGQTTGPGSSMEKGKREKSALAVNSKLQSGPSNQDVRVQHPKSVVSAIRAQNCNDGSLDRPVKGKKTSDFNKHNQVPEARFGYSQAIGSMTSTEKDKAGMLRLSVDKSFSPNPSDQVASSMYLTLSTVLTKTHDSKQLA